MIVNNGTNGTLGSVLSFTQTSSSVIGYSDVDWPGASTHGSPRWLFYLVRRNNLHFLDLATSSSIELYIWPTQLTNMCGFKLTS